MTPLYSLFNIFQLNSFRKADIVIHCFPLSFDGPSAEGFGPEAGEEICCIIFYLKLILWVILNSLYNKNGGKRWSDG